jgi:hypothetical protein
MTAYWTALTLINSTELVSSAGDRLSTGHEIPISKFTNILFFSECSS